LHGNDNGSSLFIPWKLTIEGFREGAWIHSNELEVIEMIKGWREEV